MSINIPVMTKPQHPLPSETDQSIIKDKADPWKSRLRSTELNFPKSSQAGAILYDILSSKIGNEIMPRM